MHSLPTAAYFLCRASGSYPEASSSCTKAWLRGCKCQTLRLSWLCRWNTRVAYA